MQILNSKHVIGTAKLGSTWSTHSNESFRIIKSGLIADYFVETICFSYITLVVPSLNIQN